jgi:hypothetical protein
MTGARSRVPTWRKWHFGAALALASSALPAHAAPPVPPPSPAAAPAGADREEARLRFDRGLTLYEGGDFRGALVEFERAYELTGHPLVLFNLALVQAKLGLSAEAVSALERLEPRAAELGRERAERARRTYAEQLLNVGTLELTMNVPNAVVQVDSVDVAREAVGVLRVTAGQHLVSLWAAGYEPRHVAVTVAGRATKTLSIELVPLALPVAQLGIKSPLPDVEVREQGQLLARLPLSAPLTLTPGVHTLRFERAGYTTVERSVNAEAGARAEVSVALTPASDAGNLADVALTLSEPDTVLSVDGERRLAGTHLRLPLGRHALLAERAGFFPLAREISLAAGTTRLDLELLPTPEYLDAYVSRARAMRTASFLTAGAGALLVVAGTAYLVYNGGQKSDAKGAFDAYANQVSSQPGGRCPDDACQQTLKILLDDWHEKQAHDVYGWVGVGVGGAALATGIALYLLGNDPRRYSPKARSDVFGSLELEVRPGFLGLTSRL